MREWTDLEGRVISGGFPLLRLLGTTEQSAVFLSRAANTGSNVALKLVPAIAGRAEVLLPRWRAAAALDHPHLLRLFEAGECEVEEQRYLYAVMEYAEQNLAQLLEHRALAPHEVREMLGPTLNALEFLHGSKRAHGGLKPSNVLVVGEQVKLASDTIAPASDAANEGNGRAAALSPYQPPEATSGTRSTAGDVWALGVLTCEALSRRRPAGLHAVGGGIALPADLPPPFSEIISKCLSRNPADRPDVARLQGWLKTGELETAPTTDAAGAMQVGSVTNVVAERAGGGADVVREPEAGGAELAQSASPASMRLVIRAEIQSPDELPEPDEPKAQWRPVRLIIAAVVLLAIVAAGVYLLAPRNETPPQANAPVAATPDPGGAPNPGEARDPAEASSPDTPTAQASPTQPAAQAPTEQAPTRQAPAAQARVTPPPAQQPQAAQTPRPAPAAAAGARPSDSRPPSAVAATPSDSRSALNEVLPVVPRSASDTIRGTVRVSVRVTVDEGGKVVAATSEDPGPSRYFERLSLEAAKKWTFPPAPAGEKRLMLVKFNYTRSGPTAKASAAQ